MKLMGMVMIVELSSADLCRLSVQEVSDMLLEKLDENMNEGKEYSCAKILGKCDGRMYELCMVMRNVEEDTA